MDPLTNLLNSLTQRRVGGRQNHHIWSRVNFENTDHAIARRLRCDEASVRYQRKKRSIPPYAGRGGNIYTHPEYREGPVPLPKFIQL